jgi:hypothetical protein
VTGAVTRVEGVRFPESDDVAAEKKLLGELNQRRWQANKDLFTYEQALAVGGKPLKMAARQVAHSFPVKFTSAIDQNKRLPFHRRQSLVELEQVAHDLRLEGVCSEPVPTHPKMKPNGDFRAISDFGPMHRTAQTVGRRMLDRHVRPLLRPWQHDFHGTAAAIKVIAAAIMADNTFGAHVDFKNFFGLFDPQMLRDELPVSGRMVENYLTARKLEIVPVGCSPSVKDALLSKARSGVSHGSSAAPIIGAHTVSKLNWHPAPGNIPAGYADDMMIVGASYDAVVADAKAVCAAISQLPTGKFVGVIKWAGNAADGFDYLGHHIRLGKKLEIRPADGRLDEFKLQLERRIVRAAELVTPAAKSGNNAARRMALQAISDAKQYADGWLAAFSMCDDYASYFWTAHEPTLSLLAEMGCGLKHLAPYASLGKKHGYPG